MLSRITFGFLPKVHQVFTVLLIIATLNLLASGQTARQQSTSIAVDVKSRIKHLENGIFPTDSVPGSAPQSIEGRMKHYKVPGLSIAVINNYHIEWAKGYGIKNVRSKEPVTVNTLFQAASVSKSVSAMVALRMVQEGKIALDENINDKLTSWKLPDNELTAKHKVTLANLLSHTGGTTVHGFLGYRTGEKIPQLEQILNGEAPANNEPIRVDTEPGTIYRYSGGGIVISMLAMMDIEKKPFPFIANEKVLEPLGMRNSTFEQFLNSEWARKVASGHLDNGQVVEGRFHLYPEMSAAGFWTTPTDLAKFVIEIQRSLQGRSNRVLSPQLIEKMWQPVKANAGMGLFSEKDGDSIYLLHTGSNVGFKSEIIFNKDKGYGAVVMINSDNRQFINEVVRSIAREYGWEGWNF